MNRHPYRHLPLAIALALAFGANPAQAQPGPVEPISIHIAAQSLAQALNDWARQTRLQLVVQQTVVIGKTAPAVSGRLSPREALDRLLAGSGLTGRFEGALVTIEPRSPVASRGAAKAQALPTIRVQAASITRREDGSYRSSNGEAIAPGLGLKETPAVVGVLTSGFLRDSGASRLTDVVNFIPGVTTADNVGSPSERITIRGFTQRASGIGVTGTYFNGMRQAVTSAQYRSLDNIDRIEVVKGPAGVEGGVSDPGGFVNFITKKPQKVFGAEARLGTGDHGYRTVGVDVTGPLQAAPNIQYRLIASHNELATWRPGRQKRPQDLIAPSLNIDYAPGSRVTLEYERLRSNDPLDRGTIYLKGASFARDFAGRNWSVHQATDSAPTTSERFDLDWVQRLSSQWQTRVRYQNAKQTVRTTSFRDGGTESDEGLYASDGLTWSGNPDIPIYYSRNLQHLKAESFDASVRGDFEAGGLDHSIVTGVNINRSRDAFLSYDGNFMYVDNTNSIDLLSPNNHQAVNVTGSYTNGDFKRGSDLVSAYAQWVARITPALRTVLSLRRDRYKGFAVSEPIDASPPSYNPRVENQLTSWRAATSYDLTSRMTAFVGYGNSHVPQVGIDRGGAQIEPLRAQSVEGGVKTTLFNGRALWTNTLYQITQDRQTSCDPIDPVDCKYLMLYGNTRMRGFESELVGRVLPQLQVSAGLSLMNPKILESGDGYAGKHFPNVPKVQASVFTNYGWGAAGLPQLSTKMGLIRVGKRQANSGNTYQLPAYTRVDLGLSYALTPKLSVDVNVENLFDKSYYISAQDGGTGADQVGVGNRRLLQLVIRFKI